MRIQPLREVIHVFQDITSLLQNELPIISTIRLFDLLDIAILSLIIYKLLWMLRKSSSGRVLRGILILAGSHVDLLGAPTDGHQFHAEQGSRVGRSGPSCPFPARDTPLFGADGEQPPGTEFFQQQGHAYGDRNRYYPDDRGICRPFQR